MKRNVVMVKHVLITGKNSYVGISVKNYLEKHYDDLYEIDTISVRGDEWKKKDFSKYDTVFHVAGIAHSDSGKISEDNKRKYYSINTNLTAEVAKKAKDDGVSQFIFMSSAIIYGDSAKIGKDKLITKDVVPNPKNCYGDSKLQAENKLKELSDDRYKVVILRPPMIYGKNCKGNFSTLLKMANKMPLFPDIKNQRSMLYVENLAEFVHLMIQNNESGVFWPANKEYVNTSRLVEMIGGVEGKRIRLVKGFAWLLKIISIFSVLPNKAFGNFRYDKSLFDYKDNYEVVEFEESIRRTLG